MSIAAVKYLNRFGTRTLRLPFYTFLRTSTSDCSPPKTPEPCATKDQPEPCATKVQPDPCAKQPEPPPKLTIPEPPPCPPMPQCPPTVCATVADPNNPCNYCPPPCIDTSYPDITKLKKLQCLFQQEDDLPVFLKKGNADAFLYQLTLVLTILSFGMSVVAIFKF